MMHYAPIAAFAAMAYTVGQYGAHSLLGLTELLLCFYLTCIAFILVLLGSILYFVLGLNVFKVIQYFKTEIFIVFATSSSETVMPNLLEKLTELGCDKSVVDLVIPTGYSFNLDGTAIYLTLAALFIAQATNSNLPLDQQIFINDYDYQFKRSGWCYRQWFYYIGQLFSRCRNHSCRRRSYNSWGGSFYVRRTIFN